MDISLPAEELPAELPTGDTGTTLQPPSGNTAKEPTPVVPELVGDGELDRLVRKTVAAQIMPLRRELAAYHARATWHECLAVSATSSGCLEWPPGCNPGAAKRVTEVAHLLEQEGATPWKEKHRYSTNAPVNGCSASCRT